MKARKYKKDKTVLEYETFTPVEKPTLEKKWGPILDALKVTDKNKRKFLAEYAENHMKMDLIRVTTVQESIGEFGDYSDNLLPLSLKILSMINLDGKNYQLKEDLPTVKTSADVTTAYLDKSEFKILGIDWVQHTENALINRLVDNINEQLKNKNNFYVQYMVNKMDLINENEGNINEKPKAVMSIYSRYEVN